MATMTITETKSFALIWYIRSVSVFMGHCRLTKRMPSVFKVRRDLAIRYVIFGKAELFLEDLNPLLFNKILGNLKGLNVLDKLSLYSKL